MFGGTTTLNLLRLSAENSRNDTTGHYRESKLIPRQIQMVSPEFPRVLLYREKMGVKINSFIKT